MPVTVEFRRRGTEEWKTGGAFIDLDDDLRIAFCEPQDPVNWFEGWYDWFVFPIALGATPEEIIERQKSAIGDAVAKKNEGEEATYRTWVKIAEWLHEKYEWQAWRAFR